MVKVGFVVEGGSEKIVLKSVKFQNYLHSQQIELVGDVINMDGKGNLQASSQRMNTQVQLLRDAGAEWVVVLRDMDNTDSFSTVKQEVYQASDVIICIAVQELEAWFLADSQTLSVLLQTHYYHDVPETVVKPVDLLDALRKQYTGRGITDKKVFARTMLGCGFTIERAAEHPNCPSARYFLTQLQTLAPAN